MDGFHLDDNCTVGIHFCVTGAATLTNLVFSTWSLFGQYLQVSYHREDDRQMFAASAVMRMLHQSAVVKRVWLSVKGMQNHLSKTFKIPKYPKSVSTDIL